MDEKKQRAPKNVENFWERASSLRDDRKRFGASAFFDSRTENVDEEESVLSLDSLREAFAAFDLEQNPTPIEEPLPDEPNSSELKSLSPDAPEEEGSENGEEQINHIGSEEDETLDLNPKSILEAMLFVGDRENRPLTSERASEKMRNVTPEEIDVAVTELNRNYENLGCPYHIVGDRDGYRMILRPEFEVIREKFYGKVREATLSQQAIDTLAVVAYRQPISAEEVQKLRKESSANTLSQLVRRGLLSAEREVQDKKRTMVYRTTERFLELFQLASLDDLPISEELD